mmetsp:Transcript_17079/g.27403  ORF Transcript_17079/g.27403 Transcript_17079/m.27403 type:complete len:214 (-) Transcript_17079:2098-2739(-)
MSDPARDPIPPGSFTPCVASRSRSSGCLLATTLSSLTTTRVPSRSSWHLRSSSSNPSAPSSRPARWRYMLCSRASNSCVAPARDDASRRLSSDRPALSSRSRRESCRVSFSSARLARRASWRSRSCCSARSSPRLNFILSYEWSSFSRNVPRSCSASPSSARRSDVRYTWFFSFSLPRVDSSARTSFSALRILPSNTSPPRCRSSRSCAALMT